MYKSEKEYCTARSVILNLFTSWPYISLNQARRLQDRALNTIKKFQLHQSGSVTPIVAIILPVMLILGAFTIESGNTYVRISQLNHLAYQSANSGLLAFAEILTDEAKKKHATICTVEFPPSICSSSNPFDFLTYADIQSLALQTSVQHTVQQNVIDFSLNHDPQTNLESVSVTVQFPDDITQSKIWLRTQITEDLDRILPQFLPLTEDGISVEAVASLPIQ